MNRKHGTECPSEKPFVLLAQPSLFDASRAPSGRHTAWAYCHVPNGSTKNMTAIIEAQVERFAPAFRGCDPRQKHKEYEQLEHSNANLIGGDIAGGANDLWQLLSGLLPAVDPYRRPEMAFIFVLPPHRPAEAFTECADTMLPNRHSEIRSGAETL